MINILWICGKNKPKNRQKKYCWKYKICLFLRHQILPLS